MSEDREGSVLLFGFHGGNFYVTIAENGGPVTTWRFPIPIFLAGFSRATDALRSYSSRQLHAETPTDRLDT
jgi:hypothetical protein